MWPENLALHITIFALITTGLFFWVCRAPSKLKRPMATKLKQE